MTILYNCHTDSDEYRITKFNDGEVESSYLCSTDECQCPAGSRPTCRHRQMLPLFLKRGAVDTFWFYSYERNGWVSNEPAELLETRLATKPALDYCERSELYSYSIIDEAFNVTPKIPDFDDLILPTKPSWRRL